MKKTKFNIKKDELAIIMERTFNAPRETVFNAFIDSEIIPNWWGPAKFSTTIEKNDVKEGGSWRFVHKGGNGNEFAFNGKYMKILKPELLKQTFNFEGIPGVHELVQTTIFEDGGDRTKVISTNKYKNIEELEGMINSGMESGATEGWERLAKLLEKQ